MLVKWPKFYLVRNQVIQNSQGNLSVTFTCEDIKQNDTGNNLSERDS